MLTRLPARWPLAVVMTANRRWFARKRGFGSGAPKLLFPLKDTPLLAAGFFIMPGSFRQQAHPEKDFGWVDTSAGCAPGFLVTILITILHLAMAG